MQVINACVGQSGVNHKADVRKVQRLLNRFHPRSERLLKVDGIAGPSMSPETQLDYVESYFKPYAGRLHSIEDIYMTILYPKAIGQKTDYVLFSQARRLTSRIKDWTAIKTAP